MLATFHLTSVVTIVSALVVDGASSVLDSSTDQKVVIKSIVLSAIISESVVTTVAVLRKLVWVDIRAVLVVSSDCRVVLSPPVSMVAVERGSSVVNAP